jgi:hypothetical protein
MTEKSPGTSALRNGRGAGGPRAHQATYEAPGFDPNQKLNGSGLGRSPMTDKIIYAFGVAVAGLSVVVASYLLWMAY